MKVSLMLIPALLLAGCAGLGPSPAAESQFAGVQYGMTRDETLRLLGEPFETMRFPMSRTESWDYHFQDAWGYMASFSVVFGDDGRVVARVTQRLNEGGDHGT